jgi:hypothetical protein
MPVGKGDKSASVRSKRKPCDDTKRLLRLEKLVAGLPGVMARLDGLELETAQQLDFQSASQKIFDHLRQKVQALELWQDGEKKRNGQLMYSMRLAMHDIELLKQQIGEQRDTTNRWLERVEGQLNEKVIHTSAFISFACVCLTLHQYNTPLNPCQYLLRR